MSKQAQIEGAVKHDILWPGAGKLCTP